MAFRIAFRVLLILLLAGSAGGCFYSPAADTVLRFRQPGGTNDDGRSIGFRNVIFDGHAAVGQREGVGSGWHPQEHESYLIFWTEGYPLFESRFVHVTEVEPDHFKVEIALFRSLLPGYAGGNVAGFERFESMEPVRGRVQSGRLVVPLEKVQLVGEGRRQLIVSGRIVAVPKEGEEVRRRWEEYLTRVQEGGN